MMDKRDIAKIAQGHGPADEKLIPELKSFSMLHCETLRILWALAAEAGGPILEIGPFMGASTIALAKGAAREKIISVEIGGQYDHDTLPTDNILRDLRRNLARYGVERRVTVLEGWNYSDEIKSSILRELNGRKIGLLFIDSDGDLDRDLAIYRPLLSQGAFLIFDDFESEGAPWKAHQVRPFVEHHLKRGTFSDLGVYQWGTWIGIYNGTPQVFPRWHGFHTPDSQFHP